MHHHFYPRSPCGERPTGTDSTDCQPCISIHALLAESDFGPIFRRGIGVKFLSTLSLRRATGQERRIHLPLFPISIHALLAESDPGFSTFKKQSPIFLSTLSLRRATKDRAADRQCQCHFYPRSPCGERLRFLHVWLAFKTFLSTLSLRRATSALSDRAIPGAYFYPRSPCGERRGWLCLL